MNGSRTVWVTRHGIRQDFVAADWHETAQRPHDTPLAQQGFQQALETGQRLLEENIAAIYASPFLRTVQTAHVIADVLGLKIYVEYGICEALKPKWYPQKPQLLSLEMLQEEYPRIDPNYQSLVMPIYPEANDALTFERCKRASHAITASSQGNLLLVGHGASVEGVVRGLTGATTGFACHTCALNKIVFTDGSWQLAASGIDHLSIRDDELRFF